MAKNEIQKVESVSPNQMIQLAIEGKADLEKLEKLLELQTRHEANEARKVFASEFAIVQSKIAAVVKTKINPQTHSKYAGLDSVIDMSKPVYTEQGFSIIFYEGKTDVADNIRVCADVLHRAGHKETYHFDVPLDGVGIKGNANMTKIHGKASSVSYGRRYLLCMIWNIPTQDDDGQGAGDSKPELPEITEQNKKVLKLIYAKLQESLPFGKVVDQKAVNSIFFGQLGKYPSKVEKIEVAVAQFISLGKQDVWAKDSKPVTMAELNKTLDQAFFNFTTEHQDYLADQDGKMEFANDMFIRAVTKEFGTLPTDKTAQEIAEAINPEDVAVIAEPQGE